jgi:hypothetical protein
MNPLKLLFARASICIAAFLLVLPGRAAAQIDIDTLRVDSLRRAGHVLRWERLFRRVERVFVIDMIPNAQSNDTSHDGEPNLAVNPANVNQMVGSAFTPNPTGATDLAPVFVSTNAGASWAMRNIVPSANGMTGDISLDFARRGGTLYTGILRGGAFLRQAILRTNDPFAGGTMTVLTDHDSLQLDQPYVTAATTNVAGTETDRVYVGFNAFDQNTPSGGNGQTAAAEFSLNARSAAAPAGFNRRIIEARNTFQQNMPATRFAVHRSGVIYGLFYRWTAGATPNPVCDIVVVRDDSFATGATPFAALTDPADGLAGRLVVTGRTVPAFPANLGQNRLVASNLSIAVDPNDSTEVWIAWADRPAGGAYTLHVRRSTDSGVTWSAADLLTIASATNPGLAINSGGLVGFAYQELTGTAPNQRWQTHFRRTADNGINWSDMILADVPNATGFMGDYLDLISVADDFYGIFPTLNTPNNANFPQGVIFQRNVNFATNQVRNVGNTANVRASIDPFFFKVTTTTLFDFCILRDVCRTPQFDPGRLTVVVDSFPTRVIDPIPENCLVKWSCPGCTMGLCPPFYHMYFDNIDPAVWRVEVVDFRGEPVKQRMQRVGNGIVLSFRPRADNFNEKQIGRYFLTFETLRPVERGRHTFPTRLEVDAFPQSEHLRRKNMK